MRISDIDVLLVPDGAGDTPDHWLRRWASKLPSARRVDRAPALAAAAAAAARPVVIVAHGTGVGVVVEAAPRLGAGVAGAFLVAPAAAPPPAAHLPFPALLVASRDDPGASFADAEALARALGADLVDGGASGRFDEASGHGPWPEGLMRFAGFLKRLNGPAPA